MFENDELSQIKTIKPQAIEEEIIKFKQKIDEYIGE